MKMKTTDDEKRITDYYKLILQLYQDELKKQESLDSKLTQLLGASGLSQSLLLAVAGLILNAKSVIPSEKYSLILLVLCVCIIWFGIATVLALLGLWPRQYSSFSIDTLQDWVENDRPVTLTLEGWLTFIRRDRVLNKQKGFFTWLTTFWITIGSAVLITVAVIVIVSG